MHDKLTGLPSAQGSDRIAQHFAGAGETGGSSPSCSATDDFKLENDTLGHETGDALLMAVASRITQVAPDCQPR